MYIPYNYLYNIYEDDDFCGILQNIIDRIDEKEILNNDLYELISQAIDDEIIYFDDEWTILKFYYYNDIRNANYYTAIETLETSIATIIKKFNIERK